MIITMDLCRACGSWHPAGSRCLREREREEARNCMVYYRRVNESTLYPYIASEVVDQEGKRLLGLALRAVGS